MSRALPPHWVGADLVQQMAKAQMNAENASKKQGARLGRKGFLYLQKKAVSLRPEELVRITARRVLKAERDERMDVTQALTPVKQYMAGFTRPSDLRTSNWFPGGRYITREKIYESPAQEAYEPHTVFLLESRYNIRHGIGRVESPEYIYGVCREQDLPDILKMYNSKSAGRETLEIMDNARWPWGPQASPKRKVKWWTNSQDMKDTLLELGENPSPASTEDLEEGEGEDGEDGEKPLKPAKTIRKPEKAPRRVTSLNPIRPRPSASASLPADLPPSSPASARAFHSSSILFVGHSYNDDHIVPDFYVQRKQAKEKKEAEDQESQAIEKPQLQDTSSLMDHLSDGIMSDGIVASTRRLASKIPTELFDADGVLVHPSGFVIPTPSHSTSPEREQRERDLAQQTAAVAERVLEEDFTDVTAETLTRHGKVPFEVRHQDGTVSHPSGFEPPTAADEFEHSGNSTVDSHIGQQPLVLPGTKRGLHTTASTHAQLSPMVVLPPTQVFVPRSEYLPTLDEKPFWRPLLTLTVSTRPLALTLLRLSKGQATGRPFHADLNNDDRKCRISYTHRMRGMRVKRMENLAVEMAQVLAGMRGGIIGLRFDTESMGRGVGGEALESSVPWEKRVIGVGVAKHYRLADDVKEMFRVRGKAEVFAGDKRPPFDVFALDDSGRKLDRDGAHVVPWRTRKATSAEALRREPWYQEYVSLRYAIQLFRRQAVEMTAAFVERKAAKQNEEDEDDDGELLLPEDMEDALSDEENTSAPKTTEPTVVLISAKEGALERLQRRLEDNDPLEPSVSFAELDEPPYFLIKRAGGGRILGPPDDMAKDMTRPLNSNFARQVLQRRLDLICLKRRKELALIMSSRSNKVIYPDGHLVRAALRGEKLVAS
ncbi:hypothetical protein FB451DRAFT_1134587 [Mycena latifolia]|nr:hypothetical protein FB451DRAFT_1134587 [Mycena latifolia]